MDIPLNSYKGKNVLVTGHTGFKGSWLALWLNILGANVIGYALDPVNSRDNFNLTGLKDRIIDIRGDIRDYKKLCEVFHCYKPEVVFHLAAQPLVSYSYKQPRYTYEVNVMGTVNVLDAIRENSETRIGIIITSDKCYENKEWIWGYRESDALGGYDPYSSSKGCVELLVSSYRNSFFNINKYPDHRKLLVTARAGNVIGGGDWSPDRIIPDCIKALESDRDILIKNPNSIRPWQHVLEPLYGYLILGSKLLKCYTEFSGSWNFGPFQKDIITVEEVVLKIIKNWGSGAWTTQEDITNNLHEATLLSLDISKALLNLNWRPRWNIEKAIEKTIDWYKTYKYKDIYELCTKQIDEYCNS
jgi:CDP-glucose 4,6-dehydratase